MDPQNDALSCRLATHKSQEDLGLGFKGLGFKGLGFKGLGFKGLGFKGLRV